VGGHPHGVGCSSPGGVVYPGGVAMAVGPNLKLCPPLIRCSARVDDALAGTTEVPRWRVVPKKQESVLKLVLLNLKNQTLPFVKLQRFVFPLGITFER
jgi:hypothetical protein